VPYANFALRRIVAGSAIVALLPVAPAMLTVQGTPRQFALPAVAAYGIVVVALARWLWPQCTRLQGVLLVAPAFLSALVGVFAALSVAIVSLCGSGDNGRTYLTNTGAWIAASGFVLPYLVCSTWAVAKPARAAWAWPLAILIADACGLVILAAVEGGAHYCYT
jgi:hypothetical protein